MPQREDVEGRDISWQALPQREDGVNRTSNVMFIIETIRCKGIMNEKITGRRDFSKTAICGTNIIVQPSTVLTRSIEGVHSRVATEVWVDPSQ